MYVINTLVFFSHVAYVVNLRHEITHVLINSAFCICEKKEAQISCAITSQLISGFAFANKDGKSLFLLNPTQIY